MPVPMMPLMPSPTQSSSVMRFLSRTGVQNARRRPDSQARDCAAPSLDSESFLSMMRASFRGQDLVFPAAAGSPGVRRRFERH